VETVIYHRDLKRTVLTGDIAQIQVGDSVTYMHAAKKAYAHGVVQSVDFSKQLITLASHVYSKFVLRKPLHLAFSDVLRVTRGDAPHVSALAPMGPEAPVVVDEDRDPRIPAPGTVLTREYKGRIVTVTVLPSGFDTGGMIYKSLSKAAGAACGQKSINGFVFFKL